MKVSPAGRVDLRPEIVDAIRRAATGSESADGGGGKDGKESEDSPGGTGGD